MTEIRKQLNKEIRAKKDHKPIDSMNSRSIVWFLIRRHVDNISIIITCLVLGYIIGINL